MLFGWPVIPRRRGQKDRFFLSKTQSKFALSTLPSTLLVKALAISLLAWARLICSTAWFPASPSITTCNGFGANSFIAPFDASTPAPMMPPSSRLPAIAVPPPPEIDDIPLVVTVLYPGLLSVMVAQLLRVRPRVSSRERARVRQGSIGEGERRIRRGVEGVKPFAGREARRGLGRSGCRWRGPGRIPQPGRCAKMPRLTNVRLNVRS